MKHTEAVRDFTAECLSFAEKAAPFCIIEDEEHYIRTLETVEALMEEAEDSATDPLNPIIEMLADAIEQYETADPGFADFNRALEDLDPGIAVVRLLMDQHGLGMSDLPEIGSKSMVSRVLSGERELSKKHILALAGRFGLEPALFF